MKVSIIGAGRVGSCLGVFLHKRGANIVGYYSKTYPHALRAAQAVGACAFEHLETCVASAELVIIAVNDDAIEVVAQEIAQFSTANKYFAHLSGSISSDAIAVLGDNIASVHPVASFPTKDTVLDELTCVIEGDGSIYRFFEDYGCSCHLIDKEDKSLYHAAAVIACNYVCALQSTAIDILKQCGFQAEIANRLFTPLISGTIKNTEKLGGFDALSGPLVRGDIVTVRQNYKALYNADRCWADLYERLADYIIERGLK